MRCRRSIERGLLLGSLSFEPFRTHSRVVLLPKLLLPVVVLMCCISCGGSFSIEGSDTRESGEINDRTGRVIDESDKIPQYSSSMSNPIEFDSNTIYKTKYNGGPKSSPTHKKRYLHKLFVKQMQQQRKSSVADWHNLKNLDTILDDPYEGKEHHYNHIHEYADDNTRKKRKWKLKKSVIPTKVRKISRKPTAKRKPMSNRQRTTVKVKKFKKPYKATTTAVQSKITNKVISNATDGTKKIFVSKDRKKVVAFKHGKGVIANVTKSTKSSSAYKPTTARPISHKVVTTTSKKSVSPKMSTSKSIITSGPRTTFHPLTSLKSANAIHRSSTKRRPAAPTSSKSTSSMTKHNNKVQIKGKYKKVVKNRRIKGVSRVKERSAKVKHSPFSLQFESNPLYQAADQMFSQPIYVQNGQDDVQQPFQQFFGSTIIVPVSMMESVTLEPEGSNLVFFPDDPIRAKHSGTKVKHSHKKVSEPMITDDFMENPQSTTCYKWSAKTECPVRGGGPNDIGDMDELRLKASSGNHAKIPCSLNMDEQLMGGSLPQGCRQNICNPGMNDTSSLSSSIANAAFEMCVPIFTNVTNCREPCGEGKFKSATTCQNEQAPAMDEAPIGCSCEPSGPSQHKFSIEKEFGDMDEMRLDPRFRVKNKLGSKMNGGNYECNMQQQFEPKKCNDVCDMTTTTSCADTTTTCAPTISPSDLIAPCGQSQCTFCIDDDLSKPRKKFKKRPKPKCMIMDNSRVVGMDSPISNDAVRLYGSIPRGTTPKGSRLDSEVYNDTSFLFQTSKKAAKTSPINQIGDLNDIRLHCNFQKNQTGQPVRVRQESSGKREPHSKSPFSQVVIKINISTTIANEQMIPTSNPNTTESCADYEPYFTTENTTDTPTSISNETTECVNESTNNENNGDQSNEREGNANGDENTNDNTNANDNVNVNPNGNMNSDSNMNGDISANDNVINENANISPSIDNNGNRNSDGSENDDKNTNVNKVVNIYSNPHNNRNGNREMWKNNTKQTEKINNNGNDPDNILSSESGSTRKMNTGLKANGRFGVNMGGLNKNGGGRNGNRKNLNRNRTNLKANGGRGNGNKNYINRNTNGPINAENHPNDNVIGRYSKEHWNKANVNENRMDGDGNHDGVLGTDDSSVNGSNVLFPGATPDEISCNKNVANDTDVCVGRYPIIGNNSGCNDVFPVKNEYQSKTTGNETSKSTQSKGSNKKVGETTGGKGRNNNRNVDNFGMNGDGGNSANVATPGKMTAEGIICQNDTFDELTTSNYNAKDCDTNNEPYVIEPDKLDEMSSRKCLCTSDAKIIHEQMLLQPLDAPPTTTTCTPETTTFYFCDPDDNHLGECSATPAMDTDACFMEDFETTTCTVETTTCAIETSTDCTTTECSSESDLNASDMCAESEVQKPTSDNCGTSNVIKFSKLQKDRQLQPNNTRLTYPNERSNQQSGQIHLKNPHITTGSNFNPPSLTNGNFLGYSTNSVPLAGNLNKNATRGVQGVKVVSSVGNTAGAIKNGKTPSVTVKVREEGIPPAIVKVKENNLGEVPHDQREARTNHDDGNGSDDDEDDGRLDAEVSREAKQYEMDVVDKDESSDDVEVYNDDVEPSRSSVPSNMIHIIGGISSLIPGKGGVVLFSEPCTESHSESKYLDEERDVSSSKLVKHQNVEVIDAKPSIHLQTMNGQQLKNIRVVYPHGGRLDGKVQSISILNLNKSPPISIKSTTPRSVSKSRLKGNLTLPIGKSGINAIGYEEVVTDDSNEEIEESSELTPRVYSKNLAFLAPDSPNDIVKNAEEGGEGGGSADTAPPPPEGGNVTETTIKAEETEKPVQDANATAEEHPEKAQQEVAGSPEVINEGLAGKLLNTSCLVFISTDQSMLDQLKEQYTNMPNVVIGNINKVTLNATGPHSPPEGENEIHKYSPKKFSSCSLKADRDGVEKIRSRVGNEQKSKAGIQRIEKVELLNPKKLVKITKYTKKTGNDVQKSSFEERQEANNAVKETKPSANSTENAEVEAMRYDHKYEEIENALSDVKETDKKNNNGKGDGSTMAYMNYKMKEMKHKHKLKEEQNKEEEEATADEGKKVDESEEKKKSDEKEKPNTDDKPKVKKTKDKSKTMKPEAETAAEEIEKTTTLRTTRTTCETICHPVVDSVTTTNNTTESTFTTTVATTEITTITVANLTTVASTSEVPPTSSQSITAESSVASNASDTHMAPTTAQPVSESVSVDLNANETTSETNTPEEIVNKKPTDVIGSTEESVSGSVGIPQESSSITEKNKGGPTHITSIGNITEKPALLIQTTTTTTSSLMLTGLDQSKMMQPPAMVQPSSVSLSLPSVSPISNRPQEVHTEVGNETNSFPVEDEGDEDDLAPPSTKMKPNLTESTADSSTECGYYYSQGMATIKLPPLNMSDTQQIMGGKVLNVTCMIYITTPSTTPLSGSGDLAQEMDGCETSDGSAASGMIGTDVNEADETPMVKGEPVIINRTEATILEMVKDSSLQDLDSSDDNQAPYVTEIHSQKSEQELHPETTVYDPTFLSDDSKDDTDPDPSGVMTVAEGCSEMSRFYEGISPKITENRNAPVVEFKLDLKTHNVNGGRPMSLYYPPRSGNLRDIETEPPSIAGIYTKRLKGVGELNHQIAGMQRSYYVGTHSPDISIKYTVPRSLQKTPFIIERKLYQDSQNPTIPNNFDATNEVQPDTGDKATGDKTTGDKTKVYDASCQIVVESPNSIKIVGPNELSNPLLSELHISTLQPGQSFNQANETSNAEVDNTDTKVASAAGNEEANENTGVKAEQGTDTDVNTDLPPTFNEYIDESPMEQTPGVDITDTPGNQPNNAFVDPSCDRSNLKPYVNVNCNDTHVVVNVVTNQTFAPAGNSPQLPDLSYPTADQDKQLSPDEEAGVTESSSNNGPIGQTTVVCPPEDLDQIVKTIAGSVTECLKEFLENDVTALTTIQGSEATKAENTTPSTEQEGELATINGTIENNLAKMTGKAPNTDVNGTYGSDLRFHSKQTSPENGTKKAHPQAHSKNKAVSYMLPQKQPVSVYPVFQNSNQHSIPSKKIVKVGQFSAKPLYAGQTYAKVKPKSKQQFVVDTNRNTSKMNQNQRYGAFNLMRSKAPANVSYSSNLKNTEKYKHPPTTKTKLRTYTTSSSIKPYTHKEPGKYKPTPISNGKLKVPHFKFKRPVSKLVNPKVKEMLRKDLMKNGILQPTTLLRSDPDTTLNYKTTVMRASYRNDTSLDYSHPLSILTKPNKIKNPYDNYRLDTSPLRFVNRTVSVKPPVFSRIIPIDRVNPILSDVKKEDQRVNSRVNLGLSPTSGDNVLNRYGKYMQHPTKIIYDQKKPSTPDGAIINNDDINKMNRTSNKQGPSFAGPYSIYNSLPKNWERVKINSLPQILDHVTEPRHDFFTYPEFSKFPTEKLVYHDWVPNRYTINREVYISGGRSADIVPTSLVAQTMAIKRKVIEVTPQDIKTDVQLLPNPEDFFRFRYPQNLANFVNGVARTGDSRVKKVPTLNVTDTDIDNDLSFILASTEPVRYEAKKEKGRKNLVNKISAALKKRPHKLLKINEPPENPILFNLKLKQPMVEEEQVSESDLEKIDEVRTTAVTASTGYDNEKTEETTIESTENSSRIVEAVISQSSEECIQETTTECILPNTTQSTAPPARIQIPVKVCVEPIPPQPPIIQSAAATQNKTTIEVRPVNDTADQSKLWDIKLSPLELREIQAKNMMKYMDTSVNPCQDFYQYACGNWHKYHPIPADHGGFDTFEMLRENLDLHLQRLLEDDTENAAYEERSKEDDKISLDLYNFAPNQTVPWPYFEEVLHSVRTEFVDPIRKAKNLYNSCMKENLINKRGDKPLLHLLSELRGWPVLETDWDASSFDLVWLLGELRLYNNDLLISEWIGPDIKNSDEYVIQLDQTSLGLPSREYFLSETSREYIEAYHQFMLDTVYILGAPEDQAIDDVRDIIDFEIKLATITADPEDRRNLTSIYARLSLGELQIYLPQFDWIRYFEIVAERDIPITTPIVCYCITYLQDLVNLVSNTKSRTLANYLLWRFVRHRVNNLDERFQNAKQKFYHLLFGREASPPRWQFCVAQVNSNLGMALGNLFVNAHFDERSKNDTILMTRQLEFAFKNILMQSDWLDDSTRSIAIAKVDAMRLRIGYPDIILNKHLLMGRYKDIKVHPDYYFENSLSILRHLTRNEHLKIGKMVDKNMWNTAPAVVNAYYSRNKNQIMFPAGILQPPFYHQHFPKALNYGGIGVVIGHEITHGFDDKGRLFDKDGNLNTWWSDQATEKFRDKARCIVDQYNSFVVPEVNAPLDGMTTQGENIADNGGIKQAFKAYQEWLRKHTDQPLPGFNVSNNQLFFLNFAQVWCGSSRPEAAKNRLKTAVHSPGRFRVIGTLRNSWHFAEAYECPAGSPMNPVSKCMVW